MASTNEFDDVFGALAKDRLLRREVTRRSHKLFFALYLHEYVKTKTAAFQDEMFHLTEDASNRLACIVAFRGSSKSTIITLSYALWAVLGVQRKKFVLIVCQTQEQAKTHMRNIRAELEGNELLRSDMGPFREESGEGQWAISSIVFQNTGARISIASVEQRVRGIRHRADRPDLIILDDIEDTRSVRTQEGRESTFRWFTHEIVPLGDIGTRIIIVGNLLHEESLVMRLKQRIDTREMDGVYRWYPLIDEKGACLWPEKFDIPEKIEELRRSTADEATWQQEYLLRIISDSARVIAPEWIQTYERVPFIESGRKKTIAAADLAISEKTWADCTAIVTATVTGYGDSLRIYIHPNPINTRMNFPDAIECMKAVVQTLGPDGKLFVEAVGFQEAYTQLLSKEGYRVEPVKVLSDKRTRLTLTGNLVREGKILFPKAGCEELLAQILGFGVERHDDLADAFSMLVQAVLEEQKSRSGFQAWMEFERMRSKTGTAG